MMWQDSTSLFFWGSSKQHMKLQQPRNYDFRVSQFDPPRSQSGNDRETTTKVATTVKQRLLHLAIIEAQMITLTTTAKLQQLRINSREMTTFAASCNDREMQRPRSDKLETAQFKLHNCCKFCVRFCVASWLLSFQVPFGSLWFSPPGNRAIFSTVCGDCRTKLHRKPGEKGKHPLETIPKYLPEIVTWLYWEGPCLVISYCQYFELEPISNSGCICCSWLSMFAPRQFMPSAPDLLPNISQKHVFQSCSPWDD